MTRVLASLVLLLPFLSCASTPKPAEPTQSAADRAAAEDPLYSFNLLRQGSALLQQQRFPEALERFERSRALSPTNATVHNMVGLCLMQMGRLDEAVTSFDRALELIPNFTDAHNNRGSAYLAQGKLPLAESDFLAVLADTTYPHRWETFYNLGVAQLQQGRLSSAEESFRRAAYAPLPVFPAYLRLAEIAQRQGNTDLALDLLEEARVKYPERVEAALALGRLLVQLGRVDEARPHLDAVIRAESGSAMAEEARTLLGGR
jgi:tetratricopeptide (TPR) repeat protein